MADIATAYIQIKPTLKGVKNEITSELGGNVGSSSGSMFGGAFVSTLKKVVAGAAIGKMIEKSLSAGGDLQQSFGGLETIYGEAADQAKEYALAATQAGMSANEYAEQAVSFGASLKQAFGGDTVKAAEAANTAIMDMADNSAKMGTDITAIQSAYQGFAKQNYTMLDNLKLGYGGTKTEMQRLLKDAEKLSGVKYDIDNLGDVYEAIHVIQGELGLTGVAAQEGATTFTGSMKAIKASLTNVMAGLSLGQDITPQLQALGQNITNFFSKNLLPMVANIFKQLPTLLVGAGGAIAKIAESFITFDWLGTMQTFMTNLATALSGAFTSLGIPASTQGALDIIFGFVDGLTAQLPQILNSGMQIVSNLFNGLIANIPQMLGAAAEIISGLIAGIGQRLPDILQTGIQLIGQLVAGLINAIPKILQAIPQIIQSIVGAFSKFDWLSIGTDIISGIARGIANAGGLIVDAAKNAAKSAFEAAQTGG